jgi:4-hydroxy-tetrahydrodipicolinate synthase
MSIHLKGVIPPMLTPLDTEERIERSSVSRLVEHLIQGGVHGIFVLGTGGEGTALRASERRTMVEETVKAVAGRVPILVGCSAVSTQLVLEQIEQVADLAVAAAVVTPPYYYGTNDQTALAYHFRRIAEDSSLPIVIYNIPQTTHSMLAPETMAALAEMPNIIAVKDSCADMAHFRRLLELRPYPEFSIFQGSEVPMLDSLKLGADGLVPGSGNLAPRWLVNLYEAAKAGDWETARLYQEHVNAYRAGCYTGGYWLTALKGAADMLGLCSERCTAPLPALTPEHRQRVHDTLHKLGLL